MDTLPQEILFGEIARHASRVSRRFLALTCREYLRALPKICPRPIANIEDATYKNLAETPDKYKLLPVNCAYSPRTMIFVAAKLGYFPDKFYSRRCYAADLVMGLRDQDNFLWRAVHMAQKHGNSTILYFIWSILACRQGYPAMVIARGHYDLLAGIRMFGATITGKDAKYLVNPAVFDYMLEHAPDMFSGEMIEEYAKIGLTAEQLQRLEQAGVCCELGSVELLLVYARSGEWELFDVLVEDRSIWPWRTDVMDVALIGGYDHVFERYPEWLEDITPLDYTFSPYFAGAPKEIHARLFRDAVILGGLDSAAKMCLGNNRFLRGLFVEEVRRVVLEGQTYTLNSTFAVASAYLRELLEVGALPSRSNATHTKEYAAMLRDYHWPAGMVELAKHVRKSPNENLVRYLKRLGPGPLTGQERTELVKTAYVLDDLELLLLIIGDAVKYPHSACRALPADSKIRAWRVANGLPCKPTGP